MFSLVYTNLYNECLLIANAMFLVEVYIKNVVRAPLDEVHTGMPAGTLYLKLVLFCFISLSLVPRGLVSRTSDPVVSLFSLPFSQYTLTSETAALYSVAMTTTNTHISHLLRLPPPLTTTAFPYAVGYLF
jgi:hypothetical protein